MLGRGLAWTFRNTADALDRRRWYARMAASERNDRARRLTGIGRLATDVSRRSNRPIDRETLPLPAKWWCQTDDSSVI